MIKQPIAKKIIYFTLAFGLILSHISIAYADAVPDYTQGGKNPVSSQIETYLCAPSAYSAKR